MKKILVSTSLIVLSTSIFTLGLGLGDGIKGVMSSVQAREDEEHSRSEFQCTADKLKGNYGVLSDGFFLQVPPTFPSSFVGPFAAFGRLTVKADRTFSLNLTQNFNGTILPGQFLGTFTLNNDCTGTLTLSNGIGFGFVVVDKGREIQFMRTQDSPDTRTVITGVAKRQKINTTR